MTLHNLIRVGLCGAVPFGLVMLLGVPGCDETPDVVTTSPPLQLEEPPAAPPDEKSDVLTSIRQRLDGLESDLRVWENSRPSADLDAALRDAEQDVQRLRERLDGVRVDATESVEEVRTVIEQRIDAVSRRIKALQQQPS